MDQDALTVMDCIRAAFANVPLPPPELLATHSIDREYVMAHFAGRSHQDVPSDLNAFLGEDLLHMAPSGIHYYLSDFLVYLLKSEARETELLLNQVLSVLKRSQGERQTPDFPECTPGQRQAIVEWLEYIKAHMREYALDLYDERLLLEVYEQWINS